MVESTNFDSIRGMGERLRENVGRVMVGKGDVVELMLVALLVGGHVFIEDVPGTGKTTLAKTLARSLNCAFGRVQFTPDLMPSDVTGINYFSQKEGEFRFRPGPIFAQILLADEINRATPRTQASLLEAMQENQVTIDGETRQLPSPFLVLATQNPIELEGTFPLPEAQLDRFLLRLKIGYPSEEEEGTMLVRFEHDDVLSSLEPVVEPEDLVAAQESTTRVRLDDSLRGYLVQIVQATRNHPALEMGASPRASLALYRAAQALAVLRGRDFVLPDDIKYLVEPVLAHRLILSSQSRLRGQTGDAILAEVVSGITVPIDVRD